MLATRIGLMEDKTVVLPSFNLLTKNKLTGALLTFWAIMISYSRIYLGAHYPLDVLTGAIIGGLGAFILNQVFVKLTKNS